MKIKLTTHYTKTLADIHTPVGIYLKLRDKYVGTFLLESSEYQSTDNSFSYICCAPFAFITATKKTISVKLPNQDKTETPTKKGLLTNKLYQFINTFESEALELPFLHNGVFGYTAYDAIEFEEYLSINQKTNDYKNIPLMHYAVYRYVFVFNHFNNELHLIENTIAGQQSDLSITDILNNTSNQYFSFKAQGNESSNLTDIEFEAMVTKGKQHCKRGDVFQLVLSREFKQSFTGDEFNVYRALRMINPSPYLFLFDYGSFKLFGSSPEAQLRIKENTAEIHPIAGTYKRTGDKNKDELLAKQLLNDPKETAEHTMLVDLARNDLSRNTEHVVVDKLNEIQYYSHVIHMVSKVTGKLSPHENPIKVFFDTFPAGTLSGAPKHQAMKLIDTYERGARSFYGGAIGYIGFDGQMNQAIMIRTFLSKDNQLIYQAGAGVVINSDPVKEREEVNNKISALRKAIKIAEEL